MTGSLDTDNAFTQLQSFIGVLNNTRKNLAELTKTGSSTQKAGVLKNDPIASAIVRQIRSLTNGALVGFGTSSLYLSDLGVRTNLDGTLSVTKTF